MAGTLVGFILHEGKLMCSSMRNKGCVRYESLDLGRLQVCSIVPKRAQKPRIPLFRNELQSSRGSLISILKQIS